MEHIYSLEEATYGQLIEYNGKTYRVIDIDYEEFTGIKVLRVIKSKPLLPIAFIREINVFGAC